MTEEEARIIARVVAGADGGCDSCASGLCDELNESGLGFRWVRTKEKWPDAADAWRANRIDVERV